jgi:hypothetical protein
MTSWPFLTVAASLSRETKKKLSEYWTVGDTLLRPSLHEWYDCSTFLNLFWKTHVPHSCGGRARLALSYFLKSLPAGEELFDTEGQKRTQQSLFTILRKHPRVAQHTKWFCLFLLRRTVTCRKLLALETEERTQMSQENRLDWSNTWEIMHVNVHVAFWKRHTPSTASVICWKTTNKV